MTPETCFAGVGEPCGAAPPVDLIPKIRDGPTVTAGARADRLQEVAIQHLPGVALPVRGGTHHDIRGRDSRRSPSEGVFPRFSQEVHQQGSTPSTRDHQAFQPTHGAGFRGFESYRFTPPHRDLGQFLFGEGGHRLHQEPFRGNDLRDGRQNGPGVPGKDHCEGRQSLGSFGQHLTRVQERADHLGQRPPIGREVIQKDHRRSPTETDPSEQEEEEQASGGPSGEERGIHLLEHPLQPLVRSSPYPAIPIQYRGRAAGAGPQGAPQRSHAHPAEGAGSRPARTHEGPRARERSRNGEGGCRSPPRGLSGARTHHLRAGGAQGRPDSRGWGSIQGMHGCEISHIYKNSIVRRGPTRGDPLIRGPKSDDPPKIRARRVSLHGWNVGERPALFTSRRVRPGPGDRNLRHPAEAGDPLLPSVPRSRGSASYQGPGWRWTGNPPWGRR